MSLTQICRSNHFQDFTITKLISKHNIPILKVSCNTKYFSTSWIWPWVGIKWYFAGYRRMGSSIVGRKLDWDPSMFVDIKLSLYTWNWLWAAFILWKICVKDAQKWLYKINFSVLTLFIFMPLINPFHNLNYSHGKLV